MTLLRTQTRTAIILSLFGAATLLAQACVNNDPVEDEDGTGGMAPGDGDGDTGGTTGDTGGMAGDGDAAACDNGANFEAHVPEVISDRCETANVPNCNITDFTEATYDGVADPNTWGDEQSLTGETFEYTGPDTTLSYEASGDALNITASVAGDSYAGVGLAFGPCTDARNFDGIQITLSGDLTAGGIFDVQLQQDGNYPLTESDDIGSCPADDLITGDQGPWDVCRNNYFRAVGVNATEAITYVIPWSEFTNGAPNTIDAQQLRGLQMQMGCDVAAAPCAMTVQVHDVRFYRDKDAYLGPEVPAGGASGQ
jgi:hypothetical protein